MNVTNFLKVGMVALCAISLSSCGSKQFLEAYAPEESGLNVMKITDETANTVLGLGTYGGLTSFGKKNIAMLQLGTCREANFTWDTQRLLCMSPNGKELAYVSRINKQQNIMIRKAGPQGSATQRSFRDVADVYWGADGNLYFSDFAAGEHRQIASTNAYAGSLMKQLTSNNTDIDPVLTKDGKILFFTRIDRSGPTIWSLNLKDGSLTSCARGYNPCIVGNKSDTFICVRNSTAGNSEIWMVNYVLGQETLILSDKNKGFTNPILSPNGEWILCQGNSKSSISKKNNLDLFAVKVDGSGFIQLTYHPADDCCPTWSADGKSIYFLSRRANKDNYYNIWKMRFDL